MLVDDTMNKKLVDIDDTPSDSSPQAPPSTAPQAGPSTMAVAAQSDAAANAREQASAKGAIDFADSNYFVPPGGEAPPPDFTPYVAEYFEASDGSIISHDPHLNEDGTPHRSESSDDV